MDSEQKKPLPKTALLTANQKTKLATLGQSAVLYSTACSGRQNLLIYRRSSNDRNTNRDRSRYRLDPLPLGQPFWSNLYYSPCRRSAVRSATAIFQRCCHEIPNASPDARPAAADGLCISHRGYIVRAALFLGFAAVEFERKFVYRTTTCAGCVCRDAKCGFLREDGCSFIRPTSSAGCFPFWPELVDDKKECSRPTLVSGIGKAS